MTDDVEKLREILRPVKHVLLDFDGPVCSVFAGLSAAEVARRLTEQLTGPKGPPPGHEMTDPFAMLLHIAKVRPELVSDADRYLAQLEVEAVGQARPTQGGVEFLEACAETGRTVWIVSNNATAAIEQYVDAHSLRRLVAGFFGRVPGRPESMKPSAELLLAALHEAHATYSDSIFVGDAVRDIHAAHAAKIEVIGYANKPGKADALAEAGAVAVVTYMAAVADAVENKKK